MGKAENQPIQGMQSAACDFHGANIDFPQKERMDWAMAPNQHPHASMGHVFHLHKNTNIGRLASWSFISPKTRKVGLPSFTAIPKFIKWRTYCRAC